MDEITLDAATQALDPNAQRLLIGAARDWSRTKTSAPPDKISLLNTTTDQAATVYEIEVDVGGRVAHLNVSVNDAGSVNVEPAE